MRDDARAELLGWLPWVGTLAGATLGFVLAEFALSRVLMAEAVTAAPPMWVAFMVPLGGLASAAGGGLLGRVAVQRLMPLLPVAEASEPKSSTPSCG